MGTWISCRVAPIGAPSGKEEILIQLPGSNSDASVNGIKPRPWSTKGSAAENQGHEEIHPRGCRRSGRGTAAADEDNLDELMVTGKRIAVTSERRKWKPPVGAEKSERNATAPPKS